MVGCLFCVLALELGCFVRHSLYLEIFRFDGIAMGRKRRCGVGQMKVDIADPCTIPTAFIHFT